MSLFAYIVFAAALFSLGIAGIILNRKNLIVLLMSMELILLAVNTNLIAFAHGMQSIAGQIFVFFILTVAAVEAAIGLAILVLLYRRHGNINVRDMNLLKG